MINIHNDIFILVEFSSTDSKIEAVLNVNAKSPIFRGHFPSQPVVPGACMVQLVKDTLESLLGAKLRLKKADQIKFMNVIVPGDGKKLQLIINHKPAEENGVFIQVSLAKNDAVCFKFQGTFGMI